MSVVSSLSLDELFLSLQGEAFELGRPQLFLRLGGCPLRCAYCDTPRSWKVRAEFERHERGATRRFANPVDPEALDVHVDAVLASYGARRGPGLGLAVTGGEPLEQAAVLADWLPRWPGPVMLETAGVHADRLRALLPQLHQVSLDWKLPSTLRAGAELLETEACLRILAEAGVDAWVKLVVTEGSSDAEVADALARIAALAPALPVYLQPVTPFANGPRPPAQERLLDWSLRAGGRPRVVPQLHPLLGVR